MSSISDDSSLNDEVGELRLKVERAKLQLFYVVLAWFSSNILLLLLVFFVEGIQFILPTPMLISVNPIKFGFGPEGTPIGHLIGLVVLGEVIRNTITLYYKGLPSIALEDSSADIKKTTADMEAND